MLLLWGQHDDFVGISTVTALHPVVSHTEEALEADETVIGAIVIIEGAVRDTTWTMIISNYNSINRMSTEAYIGNGNEKSFRVKSVNARHSRGRLGSGPSGPVDPE